jgi:hypothetical protein
MPCSDEVGFDRRIRLAWLDQTAETVREALRATRSGESPGPATLSAVRAALHRALAGEIQGTDARHRTVNILTRIWLRVPEAHRALRDEALSLWSRVPDAGRLWLHWGMTLLAYPFFRDVVTTVGRFLRSQDRFTLAQVQRELVARWGERTTLDYAARGVISSLVDWGVLALGDGRGIYQGTSTRTSPHPELPIWLVEATLRSSLDTTLHLYSLLYLPSLFPFQLDISPSQLHTSSRLLILHGEGNEPLVTLRTM